MWDLPGPGIKPLSPALAGGFFTAEPVRKPQTVFEIMFRIEWIHILHNPSFRSIMPPFRDGDPSPSRVPTSLSQACVCVVSWLPGFGC